MIDAYPLQWPQGFKRTSYPSISRFQTSFTKSRDNIMKNILLMGGKLPIISTNIPLRRDGLPYSGMAQPKDCGAAVYFTWKNQQRVVACDKWHKVDDNLHAIELALESMRGLERWGVSEIMDRAFAGFTALPPPESENKNWWQVLEVSKTADLDFIEDQYKRLAKKNHPDLGGSPEKMQKLNSAIEEARRATR